MRFSVMIMCFFGNLVLVPKVIRNASSTDVIEADLIDTSAHVVTHITGV